MVSCFFFGGNVMLFASVNGKSAYASHFLCFAD
jgi:hypothetical protein